MAPIDLKQVTDDDLLDFTVLLATLLRKDIAKLEESGLRLSHLESFRRVLAVSGDLRMWAASQALLEVGEELRERLGYRFGAFVKKQRST